MPNIFFMIFKSACDNDFPVIKNLVWLKVIFILVTGWDKLLVELLTAFQTKNWINVTSSDQWMLHDYFFLILSLKL